MDIWHTFNILAYQDYRNSFFTPPYSTTAAVITIMQKVADLLVSNKYVTIIALDFSKAFDTVRHQWRIRDLAMGGAIFRKGLIFENHIPTQTVSFS